MNPQLLAKIYHRLQPSLAHLPAWLQIKIASTGRQFFMDNFIQHQPKNVFAPDTVEAVNLWGIKFRSTLGNSAGMFKNGDGYDAMARLGAGFYLGGTSTANPRSGNYKKSIRHPFINLPKADISLNFMGLPNLGDDCLVNKEFTQNKLLDCPIGWSVMRSPDFAENEGLQKLIQSVLAYHSNLQVDFIEINESCPNIKLSGGSISARLQKIAEEVISKRERKIPLIVKLSCDIDEKILIELVTSLVHLGFDGVNLGNTSTNYELIKANVKSDELKVFEYFTQNFGGGVSGVALNARSLSLCSIAANTVQNLKPNHEFHIIRSGGIKSHSDIIDSQKAGVSLNQWFNGFFDNYVLVGDEVYRDFWQPVK